LGLALLGTNASQFPKISQVDLVAGKSEHVSGWWYTYPSEKYEFVSWDDEIPNRWKNNPFMFQTTNQYFHWFPGNYPPCFAKFLGDPWMNMSPKSILAPQGLAGAWHWIVT